MVRQEPKFTPLPEDTAKMSKEEVGAANARLKLEREQQADQSYFESMEKQMILESQKQLDEIREKLSAYAKEADLIVSRRRSSDAAMAELAGKRQSEIIQMIGKYSEDLEMIKKSYPDMAEEAGRILNKAQSVSEFIGQI